MRKCDELSDPESCLNKARDDELLFVLLERDPSAAGTILWWCDERIRCGLNREGDSKIEDARLLAAAILQNGRART